MPFRILNRLKTLYADTALVLMYHRVASPAADPWQLAVSAAHFEQQLQVLKQAGNVVPLAELVERLKRKKSLRKCLALTFDDGYADNFLEAKPLLEKYGVPATFFITQHNIGTHQEFWWDELERLILQTPVLPQQLHITIDDRVFFFDLGADTCLTEGVSKQHNTWNAEDDAPTLRALLYRQLWQMMSPLPHQEQGRLLQKIRAWAGGVQEARPGYASMTQEQLLALTGNELFSVGGHTVHHPALPHHSLEVQAQEISGNKHYLQELTGSPTSLFSYPSGKYNQDSLKVLEDEGFSAAFTTAHKAVSSSTDCLKIGRFQVNNWDGATFEAKLAQWQHTH